jgi:hypothetical protein
MPQPLAGLTILDFTTLLPGPLATLMLAEAGAEVIKIERPGGEDMRRFEPRFGAMSAPSPCSIVASARWCSISRIRRPLQPFNRCFNALIFWSSNSVPA